MTRALLSLSATAVLALAGCTKTTPTVPNPFNTADRVPPPALRGTPGVDPSYYPQAAADPAAVPMAPSGYPAAPSGYPSYQGATPLSPSGYPTAVPGPAPTAAPGSATPLYGAPTYNASPYGGGSAALAPKGSASLARESPISAPTDAGPLRFASPSETALARRASAPVARPGNDRALLASSTPARRPATANAWVSGSAPVRSPSYDAGPRVRAPGGEYHREPVSLAAIQGGVPIAPLEPTGSRAGPGEPAPLRVAAPPSSTGWR